MGHPSLLLDPYMKQVLVLLTFLRSDELEITISSERISSLNDLLIRPKLEICLSKPPNLTGIIIQFRPKTGIYYIVSYSSDPKRASLFMVSYSSDPERP